MFAAQDVSGVHVDYNGWDCMHKTCTRPSQPKPSMAREWDPEVPFPFDDWVLTIYIFKAVHLLWGCRHWEGTHARADGPIPIDVQASLSGLTCLFVFVKERENT